MLINPIQKKKKKKKKKKEKNEDLRCIELSLWFPMFQNNHRYGQGIRYLFSPSFEQQNHANLCSCILLLYSQQQPMTKRRIQIPPFSHSWLPEHTFQDFFFKVDVFTFGFEKKLDFFLITRFIIFKLLQLLLLLLQGYT